jgi:predicted transcriptional regulator
MARDPSDDKTAPLIPDRTRVSVDVSPVVASHLDHIVEITGQTRSAILGGILVESLPELLARADGLKKRHTELSQSKAGRR